MEHLSPCPNCGSRALYRSKEVCAGGGYAPNYLPGLGTFWAAERFHLVICKECGLTRFFARREATAKLPDSKEWKPI